MFVLIDRRSDTNIDDRDLHSLSGTELLVCGDQSPLWPEQKCFEDFTLLEPGCRGAGEEVFNL